MDSHPPLRYVTASLKVDYLQPTPLGEALVIRGRIEEIKRRKVVVDVDVYASGKVCARGRVVAVSIPEGMLARDQTAK